MENVNIDAHAAGAGRQYLSYNDLPPSLKAYIRSTLAFLDMEPTPQRRDNLARLIEQGAWDHHMRALCKHIDGPGQQLHG